MGCRAGWCFSAPTGDDGQPADRPLTCRVLLTSTRYSNVPPPGSQHSCTHGAATRNMRSDAAEAAAAEKPRVKDEPLDAGEGGAAADLSRFAELMRRYTEPYDAACTELAEGMHLRRRESAPRLAKFPRLLTKVKRLAKAGRRGDVVRMLTAVEVWMTRHPSQARLLPRDIASLLVPAVAAGGGGEGQMIEVHDFVDLSADDAAAEELVDMETWVLDLVVVTEVKAEPGSDANQGGGVPQAVKEEDEEEEEEGEEEEEEEEDEGESEGDAATGATE